jgi:hypothetical protein
MHLKYGKPNYAHLSSCPPRSHGPSGSSPFARPPDQPGSGGRGGAERPPALGAAGQGLPSFSSAGEGAGGASPTASTSGRRTRHPFVIGVAGGTASGEDAVVGLCLCVELGCWAHGILMSACHVIECWVACEYNRTVVA